MSPFIELGVGQLPEEIAKTLTSKDKGRLFNDGGGFLADFRGGNGYKLTRLKNEEVTPGLVKSCKDSALKYLYVVPAASTPQLNRKKNMLLHGNVSMQRARHVRGGKR
jgi:hypothetical protein